MAISREAYKVLESIVGPEYISEDPVDRYAYRCGPGGYETDTGFARTMTKIAGAIIMPKTTEEVQKIVKACNRYNVPYVPWSTGFFGPRSFPYVEDAIIVDLKRMDRLEIDDKHMYAIVEPGVIASQLQAEALKRGLYIVVGGGGSQVSIVANTIGDGWSPLSYRIGTIERRMLGMEWVLPDGELLKTGSLALQDDYFWGEGPGPDLRGICRGHNGVRGCLGITTRLALKLHPFQPEKLEPTGITPDTALALPSNRVKWINFTMPSKESIVQAMYEMSKAEVGAAATKVPMFWRDIAKARSKEDFWARWSQANEEKVATFHVLRVLLVGYTSEEQLEYEERVLMEIIEELGGQARPTKPTDESWIKNADSAGMWSMTGCYMSVIYVWEALDHAKPQGEYYAELKAKYTPPLMPDYLDPGWFQLGEGGHQGYTEFLVYWDPDGPDEDTHKVDRYYVETIKNDIKKKCWPSLCGPQQPLYLTGPAYGPNYHTWMLKIKEELDPNHVSHPPVPLAHDKFVEKSEWMKPVKDW